MILDIVGRDSAAVAGLQVADSEEAPTQFETGLFQKKKNNNNNFQDAKRRKIDDEIVYASDDDDFSIAESSSAAALQKKQQPLSQFAAALRSRGMEMSLINIKI